jgi:HK97 family phage major capsid protein
MATAYEWPTAGQQNRGAAGGTPPAVIPPKTTADEKERNLAATDPAALQESLRAIVGDVIAAQMREHMTKLYAEAGIDKVDRSYLHFPEAKRTYSGQDLTDRRGWEIPEIRQHRLHLLGGWFRTALFSQGGISASALNLNVGSELSEGMVRALSTTDTEGGYLIPPGFIPEITRDIPKLSMLYKYVRNIPVPGNTGVMPKVGTNARVFWGTEGQNIQQGDPAFGQTRYSVNRMNALVMLSREIAQDSNPDIVTTVVELFQEAIIRERDKVIAIGSGDGQPEGLYSATGIIDRTSTITSISYTNLVKLKESVDQRYQGLPTFRWWFNQNVKAAVMNVLDQRGLPIFQSATMTEPGLLLGVPYSVEHSFPDNYIGIGALQYYIWFDRRTMGVERTTEGGDAFINHQMWIKFFERVDGKVALPPTVPMAHSKGLVGVVDLGT